MPKPTRIPFDRFLRKRSQRRWSYTLLTLVIAVLLILADRSGLLLETGDDIERYNGQWFTVVRVVDGDTLVIDAPDGSEDTTRIRLWGVDTPELARRDPPKPAEAFAEEATALARSLAEGERVRLILEEHRLRGNYGRLLAFVELSDGQMLNEALILAGYARADDRWNHRHLAHFQAVESQARDAERGIWGD